MFLSKNKKKRYNAAYPRFAIQEWCSRGYTLHGHVLGPGTLSGFEPRISGPEVIKLFSCSAQLRLKFILLINVKMPTIVGILTFMSRINY